MTEPRPTLSDDTDRLADACAAVEAVLAEMQAGMDAGDAEITNRHFAGDVLWGGPFGATVSGYEPLHAIHLRIQAEGRGGAARYEVESVAAPAPDVAIGRVRRLVLDPDESGAFSEVLLMVLVRRDGDWWLAAGQNTPIRPGQSADGT